MKTATAKRKVSDWLSDFDGHSAVEVERAKVDFEKSTGQTWPEYLVGTPVQKLLKEGHKNYKGELSTVKGVIEMEKGIIRTFRLKTALAKPVDKTVTVVGVQHEWLIEFPTVEQAKAFARQIREDGVEMSEEAIEALAVEFGACPVAL